jgi:H+/gluconate symporter-like permease
VIAFLGDPVFALFLGLFGAYLLAWRTLTKERVEEAIGNGFNATGQILLITGIGGSLGAVIGETGLDKILGGLFSAEAGTPALLTILLAWFIAAVLHLAIGSISVAAMTAAGILAPILGSIEVPAVVLGLAIGSGALFALQVNSNFFWMFQTLLGLTTQGTLKSLTLVTSMASVVSLVLSWRLVSWCNRHLCKLGGYTTTPLLLYSPLRSASTFSYDVEYRRLATWRVAPRRHPLRPPLPDARCPRPHASRPTPTSRSWRAGG